MIANNATDPNKVSIQALQAQLAVLTLPRTSYTVEEVAMIVERTAYTVREWCRHGKVNAFKSGRYGSAQIWRITAEEVGRYKNEGLLPMDPRRNMARNRHLARIGA